jgi:phospholipid/cholesterol/gamma-HCH transport system substrate-binding protein
VQQVNKQAPSIGRILAMVIFAMSCFGLLLFLWLAFGGPVPLKPEGYRVKVNFPEATTLAQEADVRMSGVNIGRVKTKELDKGGVRTTVELEIDERFAPIPEDTQAILRQKTLLGETYVELSQGSKDAPMLDDGDTLEDSHVTPTVELDEIYDAFDDSTRRAFAEWVEELTKATKGGRGQDLNDAFGNLAGFATDGADLMQELDEQHVAVRHLIKNTGVVFNAISERQGTLRNLIDTSNQTFEATASRDDALAEVFHIFPTFLDESKATMARLQTFAEDTHPLVNAFKEPADDLGPTIRDLGDLSPDLEQLFRELPPLIEASKTGAPALTDVLKAAEPFFDGLHIFLQEFNPILSYANFHQTTIAGFLSNGGPDLAGTWGTGERVQTQVGPIDERSFVPTPTSPIWERGNAYLQPNGLARALPLGTIESLTCEPTGEGEMKEPDDSGDRTGEIVPPCFEAPPSLYDNDLFNFLEKGEAPIVDAPSGLQGNAPTDPAQR